MKNLGSISNAKDITTKEYVDSKSENIVAIGDSSSTTNDTKLWIDTNEIYPAASEVVNSLSGNETTKAPSVYVVNNAILNNHKSTHFTVAVNTLGAGSTFDISNYLEFRDHTTILLSAYSSNDYSWRSVKFGIFNGATFFGIGSENICNIIASNNKFYIKNTHTASLNLKNVTVDCVYLEDV